MLVVLVGIGSINQNAVGVSIIFMFLSRVYWLIHPWSCSDRPTSACHYIGC